MLSMVVALDEAGHEAGGVRTQSTLSVCHERLEGPAALHAVRLFFFAAFARLSGP